MTGSRSRRYDYREDPLQSVLSMLVHCAYFRDLNTLTRLMSTITPYYDPRAEDYGKEHWDSLIPAKASESDLKDLGLMFFLRKEPHPNKNAPRLVIALRGTLLLKPGDLYANWKIGTEQLHETKRAESCRELILDVVRRHGKHELICMAGHSLGGAIALDVGRFLVSEHDIKIDTHLFNPPFVTLADFASPTMLAKWVNSTSTIAMFWLELIENKKPLSTQWHKFWKLQSWIPHFYLNPGDPLCSPYIDFYMNQQGEIKIENLLSLQGFFTRLLGGKANFIINVVPSANLHISNYSKKNIIKAHSNYQWRKTDREFKPYEFRLQLWN